MTTDTTKTLRALLGPAPDAPIRIIGLMSGTSADGVDAALLEVTGAGPDTQWKLLAFQGTPFPSEVRNEIFGLQDPDEDDLLPRLAHLHALLGEVYAEAGAAIARAAGLKLGADIHLIGMHGQTVYHATGPDAPQPPVSLQIGEAQVVAERTGVGVVHNFRPRDVAAGGTGAPLVPLVDWLLFHSRQVGRLCLNLGGIANFTALRAGGSVNEVVAFDTGPGNMLIDALARRATGGRAQFDEDGMAAARGTVLPKLLEELLRHPYLLQTPPKSAGREEFGDPFVRHVIERAGGVGERGARWDDLIATATAFTAHSVAEAYTRHAAGRAAIHEVIVSGGGARNPTLMRMLGQAFEPRPVVSSAERGLDPLAREAVAFALLANETVNGRPGNLPVVTGATRPVVLGSFTPGGGA